MRNINAMIPKSLLALAAIAGVTTVAQATVIIAPTTVTWFGTGTPSGEPISVTYEVTQATSGPLKGYYTYDYTVDDTITHPPFPASKNLTQFEVNFSGTAAIVTSVGQGGVYDPFNQDVVWSGTTLVTAGHSTLFSFVSPDAPVLYTGSALDDGPGGWASNGTPQYIAAVPEPTTLAAGAMLLLPFGASTLRNLRKVRAA